MTLDLSKMSTELRNSHTMDLDTMSIHDALKVMNEEDARVADAVGQALPQIERAVKAVIKAFKAGGRLIYVGAGTSGRLGLMDAAECPPTFGTDPGMVVALLAGGDKAFTQAVEGAEDSAAMGAEDLKAINLQAKDVVIGIAASGRTPYVLGALNYAREVGCTTAAIACNHGSAVGAAADIAIEVVPGPEVLTGSTRLKAGTAQKQTLNMISTMSMVGIGKVYQNLMVDVRRTNEKLEKRALNIIVNATECDWDTASRKLQEADGSVKFAITMILLNCDLATARSRLEAAGGHIRKAL
ncbi:MAG: N-acetylmuramic acid 6-phosphate etherase [Firmicutes bacterium]|nr:N-acetylmuramic acid 6-phosphate etherase [Bacillota bacterium]